MATKDSRVTDAVAALAALRASATVVRGYVQLSPESVAECQAVLDALPVGISVVVDTVRGYVAHGLLPPRVTLKKDLIGKVYEYTRTLEFANVLGPDPVWIDLVSGKDPRVLSKVTIQYGKPTLVYTQKDLDDIADTHPTLLRDLKHCHVFTSDDINVFKPYLAVCFPSWVSMPRY